MNNSPLRTRRTGQVHIEDSDSSARGPSGESSVSALLQRIVAKNLEDRDLEGKGTRPSNPEGGAPTPPPPSHPLTRSALQPERLAVVLDPTPGHLGVVFEHQ